MASTDALALPLKNTAFRVYFPVYKNDGTLITGWTGAAAVRSLDGGTESAATNTGSVTEIATSSGKGFLDLTAAEMNTNCTVVTVTVTNTSALPTVIVLYPATDAMIRVNVANVVAGVIGAAAFATHALGAIWDELFGDHVIANSFGAIIESILLKANLIGQAGTTAISTGSNNGVLTLTAGMDYLAADGLARVFTAPAGFPSFSGGSFTGAGLSLNGAAPIAGNILSATQLSFDVPRAVTLALGQGVYRVSIKLADGSIEYPEIGQLKVI